MKFFAAFGITIVFLIADALFMLFLSWIHSDNDFDFDEFCMIGFIVNALLASVLVAIIIVNHLEI